MQINPYETQVELNLGWSSCPVLSLLAGFCWLAADLNRLAKPFIVCHHHHGPFLVYLGKY